MDRDKAMADLMLAEVAFDADPTEENLIRLNEARETAINIVILTGKLPWPPTKH